MARSLATKISILSPANRFRSGPVGAMISAGVSLSLALSAFRQMFNGEQAQVLRAIGYFKDGDLNTFGHAMAAKRHPLICGRN